MLSTRAIATQGLGFGPRLTAVQGLWPVESGGSAPGRRGPRPDGMPSARRLQAIDDEDALLLLITMAAGAGVLQ